MTVAPQPPSGTSRARFERLVLPFAPALYRTARRLTRRTDEATDITRETVVRAYRDFDGTQPDADIRAWLFGELWATLVEFWRQQGLTVQRAGHESADEVFAAALDGDRDDLDRTFLARLDASPEVDVALRHLPKDDRFAVLLVDVEDLSYEEAARALGCDVPALATRLLGARARLCAHLVDYARRTTRVHQPPA
jgi:RNA polymerase sigma-70 factor (ECF subfamily)